MCPLKRSQSGTISLKFVFIKKAYAEDQLQGEKLRWWSIYQEPEHELVGKVQLYINYSTSLDENNLKVSQ